MKQQQKEQLMKLIAEHGQARVRGLEIAAAAVMMQIAQMVESIPEPTDNHGLEPAATNP